MKPKTHKGQLTVWKDEEWFGFCGFSYHVLERFAVQTFI
jgi:hypothetical protein